MTLTQGVFGVNIADAQHGKGLFTARTFTAGEQIGEIIGVRFLDADYSSDYCIDLGDGMALEPAEPFRFMNHSCEPNCKLFVIYNAEDTPAENRHVVVEAQEIITEGIELTIDYEWPACGAIPCGCGATNCRGWIVDPTELHLVPPYRM
ncbi:MAG: SET domain-containing protein-lysine N-methyltransferase [Planctomycetaceae bacterium]